jgi:hypothetical protein
LRGFNVAASFSSQGSSAKAALWSISASILEGFKAGLQGWRRAERNGRLAGSSLQQFRKFSCGGSSEAGAMEFEEIHLLKGEQKEQDT